MKDSTIPKYINSIHKSVIKKFFQFSSSQSAPIRNSKTEKLIKMDQTSTFIKSEATLNVDTKYVDKSIL